MPESTNDFFQFLAKVLLRCWILGFALLFLWAAAVLLGGEPIYRRHGPLFNLSPDELRVIHYCGILLFKLFLIVFFFIPWIAIKLALRKPHD